ncbi:hypothetical protein [Nannocystis sp.]|uniref:hypothetical protein n=1 Tax=Nannocystis sp. TaxID=1962667 RepID=UPI0025F0F0FF|nr:hypothetical protein [Nannocystis sp.]MBK7826393.1 hypothetical protein [Nannocystis sp.]
MTPRHPLTVLRAALAIACSVSLALPAAAHARSPQPEPTPDPGEATDELSPQAQQHVVKAYQQYKNQAYAVAEAELRRAAFFAPQWRPLHFNLGVMAEAQGKLGTAVREYKSFIPFALADEAIVAEQRIEELSERRSKIASGYKRQIAVGATTLTFGAAATGAGVGLLVYGFQKKSDSSGTTEAPPDKFITAGYLIGLVGVLVLVYSFVPLSKAIKAKRQLDGLALGKARLRLAGGGVNLRF